MIRILIFVALIVACNANKVDELMTLCLDTVANENVAPTEGCAGRGPGIFTPPGVARAYAACGVAMYNSWTRLERIVHPMAIATPYPRRLPVFFWTDNNREEALTRSVYQILVYLLPNRATSLRATILSKYNIDVSIAASPVAMMADDMAARFVAYLRSDRSNQQNCYADTTRYASVNDNIVLTNRTTVQQSFDKLRSATHWSDIRFMNLLPAGRSFLMPHAGTVKPYTIVSPSNFLPENGTSPYPSTRALLDAEMLELTTLQSQLEANGGYWKMVAEFWADGPRSYLPPGHWQQLAIDVVSTRKSYSLDQSVRMLLLTSIAVHDAAVVCWFKKRVYDSVRPTVWLPLQHFNDSLQNQYVGPYCPLQSIQGWQWRPYQSETFWTPPFPDFPSGHSTFSAASAKVLELFTGGATIPGGVYTYPIKKGRSLFESQCYQNGTDLYGAPCVFHTCRVAPQFTSETNFAPTVDITLGPYQSFYDMSDEAGISRRYGGIHHQASDLEGRVDGRKIGEVVFSTICRQYWGGGAMCNDARVSQDHPHRACETDSEH